MKKKVLIFTGYYTPSVKGGGPIQSIKNLVDNLSEIFDFYIVTSDRDLGDSRPFANITTDKWVKVDKANVFYTDTKKINARKLVNLTKSHHFDTLYLNGFFIYKYSILPVILLKMNLIKIRKVILAPRGEFSTGALLLKKKKKDLYILLSKIFRLYSKVIWHSTAKLEELDINRVFTTNHCIKTVSNMTEDYSNLVYNKKIVKEVNHLKIIFISRIHPKKNLKQAIEYLKHVNGHVEFNIYGPIEDNKYWQECKNAINELDENKCKVSYNGVINHSNVREVFKKNHIFLFPTLGENFGHVISESLISGCPVIISDQTPWGNLEKAHVGWDIDINDNETFINKIQYFLDLSQNEYNSHSVKAFEFAKKLSVNNTNVKDMRELFE